MSTSNVLKLLTGWVAVVVGFAGALIVVGPGAAGASTPAALMLLGSATCTGLYQLLTRNCPGIPSRSPG